MLEIRNYLNFILVSVKIAHICKWVLQHILQNGRMVKMKSRKLQVLAVGAALALGMSLLSGCGSEKKDAGSKKMLNVGIVQLVEHGALDAANKGFVVGMAENGFKENENVKYDRQNAQGDQSNLQNIAQRFVSNKVDLICAIATPSAQAVANATKDIPIIGTAITDYAAAKLVVSEQDPKTNVTGTSGMSPVKEQLALIQQIFPQAKTIGTIYSSSEVNSQIQVGLMKKFATEKGLQVVEATVSSVNDIQQAAQSLVGKVDVIYVPTDNVVASAMPTLAAITDRAKLGIVCGESQLIKGGGLATKGIDYFELGKQTGAMAAAVLKGQSKPATTPIAQQKEFKTVISAGAAERIGVTIPAEVLKNAEVWK